MHALEFYLTLVHKFNTMAKTSSKLIGGNFLFAETDPKEVFIPESFTEEQKMI